MQWIQTRTSQRTFDNTRSAWKTMAEDRCGSFYIGQCWLSMLCWLLLRLLNWSLITQERYQGSHKDSPETFHNPWYTRDSLFRQWTPLNSRTFAQFAKDYYFTHQTSSPEYPQNNGKVESTIKIAKNIIKKTKKTNGNVNLALLEWRNIPTEGLNSSPAQRFFGRRTRTLLPVKNSLMAPEL